MILVFSIMDDPSTNEVVDWILRTGNEVRRINTMNQLMDFLAENPVIKISKELKQEYSLCGVESVWFRRPPSYCRNTDIFDNNDTNRALNYFTLSEQKALFNIVSEMLKAPHWLNDYKTSNPGKVHQLLLAKHAGLAIPETRILSSKQQVVEFINEVGSVIFKPMQDSYPIPIDTENYCAYTRKVDKKLLRQMPDTFAPCLFQTYLNKNIEIRSFYLDGKFKSMAICSTFDNQTKVDFRHYNQKHPNRRVPYQLPHEVEQKLSCLMDGLQLNCGSLDLVLTNEGQYVYLEVNPVGQFGMVSIPCNYYLERDIADFLTNGHENKKDN